MNCHMDMEMEGGEAMTTIETPRLHLRMFREDDFDA